DAHSSFFHAAKLLDTRVLLDRATEQKSWDDLLKIRGDRNLREAMNEVYGLQLESFTYSRNSQKLKALFSDRDYALNIDDLGAGMRIAFRMAMAILLSRDSAVLAEEFDCYQHVQSFAPFVRAILRLAQKANCQLFLATHSLETVRHFISESESTGSDLRV